MKYFSTGRNLLASGVLIASMASMASAETVISFTDQSPNRGARAEAMQWFAEELSKRTKGEVKIEFHWGGALLKAKAAAKGIGDGAADMGMIVGVYNPKAHHNFLLSDLPTQYSDPWTATRALYKFASTNAAMKKEWDSLNLHYVTNVTTGPIQLVCKGKSVKTVADIKGVKVRGISVYGKVFKDLGATPVSMTAYDTYQGLDTGLIDCTMMYGYAIPAFKLQEVATDVTRLDWGALMGLGIVMNKDVYESLSADNQKVIDSLGDEFIDVFAKKIMAGNDKAFADIAAKKDGHDIAIHELPTKEKADLLKAGGTYLAAWKEKSAKQGEDGEALANEYMELLKMYDAERVSKGYPWTR